MLEEEEYYNHIAASIEEAVVSQMFGKPCLKIKGKAFASFFNKMMVFKLAGEEHQNALSLDGSELFDPSGKGRAMKEWVQVPYHYKEQWEGFAQSAMQYVSEIN